MMMMKKKMKIIGGITMGNGINELYSNIRVVEYKQWTPEEGWQDKVFKTISRIEFNDFIRQLQKAEYVTPCCIYFEGGE